jgi:hypothetical protein
MGKKSRNRGDYADLWKHIEYSVLIRSTDEYIVYIDVDGDLDWETTERYDNSIPRKPEYDSTAVNSILNDAAILEVTVKDDSDRSKVNRLLGEAIACALELDYPSARKMIRAAQGFFGKRKKPQAKAAQGFLRKRKKPQAKAAQGFLRKRKNHRQRMSHEQAQPAPVTFSSSMAGIATQSAKYSDCSDGLD